MALSLVLASCGEAEEEEEEIITPPGEEEEVPPPAEEEEVPPPTGGNWWDKFGEPEYGGILTYSVGMDVTTWDPYRGFDFYTNTNQLFYENIAHQDWTLDREIFNYVGSWTPNDRYVGWLAESWEAPDFNTMIFKIRKGIHWQDKFPANGRELTAADITWNFNRLYGTGDGFTDLSPFIGQSAWRCFKKVTATDKYTMVVEHTDHNTAWEQILQPISTQMVCRDAVEAFGDLTDWENALGTGPFILDDVVTAASMTLSKNPNYWGYDERHPENRLPYIDGIKILIIPDRSTSYAALRTGKIDWIDGVSWEEVDALTNTNPELVKYVVTGWCQGLQPRLDKEPFTDIRVRKAMNMAIDRETIAKTVRGGYVEGKPQSYLGRSLGPYYTPFEEWPKELQEEYTYNPERAKELLAEAGYPDGFTTNVVVGGAAPDDALIMKDMLMKIGIDMEIKVIEGPAYWSYVAVHRKHDQMVWMGYAAWTMDPYPGLMMYLSDYYGNHGRANDPVYDEMLKYARVAPDGTPRTEEEQIANGKACDMYILSHHWSIVPPESFSFTLRQPWIKGLCEETLWRWPGSYYARLWIDQGLKKSLGY